MQAKAVPRPALAATRVALDIAAPIGVYYVLRAHGASYALALLAGAALSTISAVATLVQSRRPDPVAAMMVAGLVSALVLSLVACTPRFLLAKDGVITALWGVWFLVSARGERPAALVFARPLMEGVRILGDRPWDLLWAEMPRFRRIWRVSSALWGIGLLVDAAIRVMLAYALPVDAVPGISGALYPATFVVLQVITNVYYTRAGLYEMLGARWVTRPAGIPRGVR